MTEQQTLIPVEKVEAWADTIAVSDILPFEVFASSPSQTAIGLLGNLGGILVQQRGEKYAIVDGLRRTQQLIEDGAEEVMVTVISEDVDANTIDLAALGKNFHRPNHISEAEHIKRLVRAGFDEKSIASRLGVSVGTIRNRIALTGAPSWALDAAKEGELPISMLPKLASLPQSQLDSLLELYSERRDADKKRCLTHADLRDVRREGAESVIAALPALDFDLDPDEDANTEVNYAYFVETAFLAAVEHGANATELIAKLVALTEG